MALWVSVAQSLGRLGVIGFERSVSYNPDLTVTAANEKSAQRDTYTVRWL